MGAGKHTGLCGFPIMLTFSPPHTFIKSQLSLEPQFKCHFLRPSLTSPSSELLEPLSLDTVHSLLGENGLCLCLIASWHLDPMMTGYVLPPHKQRSAVHTYSAQGRAVTFSSASLQPRVWSVGTVE